MNRLSVRGLVIGVACAMQLAWPSSASATDVVNGWSVTTTISSVYSLATQTMFKLNGTTAGCGHPDFWQMPLDDSAKSKVKHAALLAAFAAGKTVSLRCENSLVSDFQIFQ